MNHETIAREDAHAAELLELGDAFFELDRDWRIVRVNRRQEALSRRPRTETVGRAFAEVWPELATPESRYWREYHRCISERVAVQFEDYYAPLDLWTGVTAYPISTGGIAVFFRDITPTKRAEREQARLAAIVESTDDAVVSKDLDGFIVTWNAGAQRIFGYTAEEIVGQPIGVLLPPDRPDEEDRILAELRAGRRIDHYETRRVRKDGSVVEVSVSVSPIRDGAGRIVGASKIARDITDRKEVERKLRESEQRLTELLAAIPAAIYTTDAQGKITYFNQAAVEFSGRTPVLGSDEWCVTWKLFHPDGTPLPHDQCPMAVALKEGRAVRGAEAVAERPDGTRVPFIPFPTPLRDAFGRITGAINMLVDISERRQAESQQRLLLDELNHRTKNNMQMLQSLLFSAARTAHSEEARKVLNEASARISAMAAAQRVLYGRSDASRFAADEFLPAVCETIRQLLPPEARIECGPAHGVLSNDVAMPLALILNELLTNAVKHGVTDHARQGVRVSLTSQDGRLALCVEDDGDGYDLEEVRKNSSGLQLVLGLARQLHGTLSVTKNPSRACLDFPAVKI
jgi:PAS domain S-box-containing protein